LFEGGNEGWREGGREGGLTWLKGAVAHNQNVERVPVFTQRLRDEA